ncbi:MAG: hypothetical protein ACTSQY_05310 [Candidatus Odinarchaeia archaeon]
MTDISESYRILQQKWLQIYDVRHGDTVTVLRKAKSYELGWGDVWHFDMTRTVGKSFGIIGIHDEKGIQLNCPGCQTFPFFVLEKFIGRNINTITMQDVYEKFGYNIRLKEED